MAIVKILSSSSSFFSVDYNLSRCENGEGKLLTANNFTTSADKISYRDYLKKWSMANKRIKNSQFHVAISVKGNSFTEEQLKSIGEQWMEEMGYGKNPYLIFFHGNTANNHIHIVSSRIDSNGRKIPDNYEKLRAINSLNKIINENPELDYRKRISDCLRYSYSTPSQLAEVLISAGFKVWNDKENGNLVVRKGVSKYTINREMFNFCTERYHKDLDVKRKKQIQGLIYKYAALLSKDNFCDFMRNKFGLEFIFYGKDGSINGYTIIDQANKSVYKGSEIFGLKKIKELMDIPQKPETELEILINDIFKHNPFITYSDLASQLSKSYYIDIEGINAYDRISDEYYSYSTKIYNRLMYNTKLHSIIEMYHPHSEEHFDILSNVFKVKSKDLSAVSRLQPDRLNHVDLDKYKKLIESCILNKQSMHQELMKQHIMFYHHDNKFYLFDAQDKTIISSDDLELNEQRTKETISYFVDSPNIISVDENTESDESLFENILMDFTIPDVSGLIYVGRAVGGNSKPRKRKLK